MSNETKPIGALESLAYIWGAAGFVGFGAMALLYFMGDWSALQAIFTGGALGFALGVILTVLFGVQSVPSAAGQAATTSSDKMNAVERAMASRPDTNKVLEPVPSPHKSSIDPSPISDSMGPNAGAAGDAAAAGDRLASVSEAAVGGIANADGPQTPASGTAKAPAKTAAAASASAAASAAAAQEAAADKVAPIGAAAAADERATARADAETKEAPAIGSSAVADQTAAVGAGGAGNDAAGADDAGAADDAGGAQAAAAKTAAKSAAKADATDAAGESEGTKPELLSGPRAGGADDLKKIKGVGPKLEGELNAKGVYHYDQIAAWTDAEVAWADQNLVKFKGRVSRDKWRDQAKQLAAGGETEFSKKVDKGGVY